MNPGSDLLIFDLVIGIQLHVSDLHVLSGIGDIAFLGVQVPLVPGFTNVRTFSRGVLRIGLLCERETSALEDFMERRRFLYRKGGHLGGQVSQGLKLGVDLVEGELLLQLVLLLAGSGQLQRLLLQLQTEENQ